MDRARILIVDDHAEVIVGLRALLEADAANEVVGEATSARQAVQRAAQLKPDIVLMDFSMSDMDGVEAASEIRRANPSTEVLILSVYEAGENARRARDAGIRRWIPKSLPPDVLLQELHELSVTLQRTRE